MMMMIIIIMILMILSDFVKPTHAKIIVMRRHFGIILTPVLRLK